jgi:hypothetical protein
MAQVNAFNAALIRVGFNADTAQAIIDEGFETLDVLADIEDDNIDQMIKNVRETRRIQGAQAVGDVTFRNAEDWPSAQPRSFRWGINNNSCPPILVRNDAYINN